MYRLIPVLVPGLLYLILIIPSIYLLVRLNRTQKNFNKSINEYNRVSEIVTNYFFSTPSSVRVGSEVEKYLEISVNTPIDHTSTKTATKSYEEMTKKLIEAFSGLIPELLQERREEKLNEILENETYK